MWGYAEVEHKRTAGKLDHSGCIYVHQQTKGGKWTLYIITIEMFDYLGIPDCTAIKEDANQNPINSYIKQHNVIL